MYTWKNMYSAVRGRIHSKYQVQVKFVDSVVQDFYVFTDFLSTYSIKY
jgi:hypothetical protein